MDDRKNLPSASNAHSDSLCSGRHRLHSQFPSESTEFSEYGEQVHLAMRGCKKALSLEQAKWVLESQVIESKILSSWCDTKALHELPFHIHREKRLWAYVNGQETNSGQADVFWVLGERALLADYKSLFGDVPDATENLQIRDLVALIALNFGVKEVTAYINQPRIMRNPKLVVYDKDAIDIAIEEMRERVRNSMASDAPRIPGEVQCKYCKGKLVCEEFKRSALTPLDLVPINAGTLKPKELKPILEQRVATLEPDTLVQLRDALELTAMLDAAVEAEIRKRLLADFSSVPGMEFKPGNKTRTITDAQQAFDKLSEHLTPEEFNSCCSVAIGKLEELYRKKLGLTEKQTKEAIEHALFNVITFGQNQSSLRRVK